MKILADDDLDAVLSLVGVSGGAERMATALPGSEMRVELLARTAGRIVHVEFVKDRCPDLDLRMMTYRLRIRGRDRHTPIASTCWSSATTSRCPTATTTSMPRLR